MPALGVFALGKPRYYVIGGVTNIPWQKCIVKNLKNRLSYKHQASVVVVVWCRAFLRLHKWPWQGGPPSSMFMRKKFDSTS